MNKIKIKCKKGELPENFAAALESADENDLRVLLGVMFLADETGNAGPVPEFSEKIGMSPAETSASLKYWCGAGFLSVSKGAKKEREADKEGSGAGASKSAPKTPLYGKFQPAHKGGAVEKSGQLVPYSIEELNTLLENKNVTAAFLDEADRIMEICFSGRQRHSFGACLPARL